MRSSLPRKATRLSAAALNLVEPIFAVGQAAELGVMVHHGFAVGTDLQVDLDAIAGGHRRAHGAGGIFDDAARSVMQSAMGERPRGEPVAFGH